jgi:hypothetical protein
MIRALNMLDSSEIFGEGCSKNALFHIIMGCNFHQKVSERN